MLIYLFQEAEVFGRDNLIFINRPFITLITLSRKLVHFNFGKKVSKTPRKHGMIIYDYVRQGEVYHSQN